jgi:Predicted sugar isomerase
MPTIGDGELIQIKKKLDWLLDWQPAANLAYVSYETIHTPRSGFAYEVFMSDVSAVKAALKSQVIETPSWGYGNSGTRFKVFTQPGVPRDPFEKPDDAAQVHFHRRRPEGSPPHPLGQGRGPHRADPAC